MFVSALKGHLVSPAPGRLLTTRPTPSCIGSLGIVGTGEDMNRLKEIGSQLREWEMEEHFRFPLEHLRRTEARLRTLGLSAAYAHRDCLRIDGKP